MNFKECMNFIGSYSRLGAKVTDLSRASELMERLGNPQKKLKFVHVAGTNGKGSVLEYISKALEFSGYKTGKLTSPFVTHYTDRIRINSDEIDEKALGEICGFVAEYAADREYSQFEITMAIAFLWFAREKCDIVVLEVGIGGLLDSTNVIETNEAAVITSISLDHTAILGDTVEKIARQKVGIIKGNSDAVMSCDNTESVKEIFRQKCKSVGTAAVIPDTDDINVTEISIHGNKFEYKGEEYRTSMPGMHQVYNAVSAIETCKILNRKGFEISPDTLKKALETASVDARTQLLPGNPPTIVDGGHNVAGASALAQVLGKYERDKIYAILGMMASKDYVHSAGIIAEAAGHIFCVDGFSEGSVPAKELAAAIGGCSEVKCSSLSEAVSEAEELALKNNGIVVTCGSLYLAGEYLNMRKNRQ